MRILSNLFLFIGLWSIEVSEMMAILLTYFINNFKNMEIIDYKKSTIQISKKSYITFDPLHELISNDDKKMIATAVEAELKTTLQ